MWLNSKGNNKEWRQNQQNERKPMQIFISHKISIQNMWIIQKVKQVNKMSTWSEQTLLKQSIVKRK
jgi:hypothetical protein